MHKECFNHISTLITMYKSKPFHDLTCKKIHDFVSKQSDNKSNLKLKHDYWIGYQGFFLSKIILSLSTVLSISHIMHSVLKDV